MSSPSSVRPLAGIRVIDAGLNIAGPYAASTLADLGADVIKVEPPGGDTARAYPPFAGELGALFASINHSKRYMCLDLRRPRGREIMKRLLAHSDVLIQNLRPGKAEALGIGAADCHDINPRLVHCSVEAFYPDEQERPGYDLLVQAESGMMHLTGEADGDPVRTATSAIDHVTGIWVALAAAAALNGPRQRVALRVSMLDVALALLNERVSSYLISGVEPQRMGSATPTTTPHQAYATADSHIVIGAASDAIFHRFAAALGPPLQGDERFATQQGRLAHRGELDAVISAILSRRSAEEWRGMLADADVPVAVVHNLPTAVANHARRSATGLRPVRGTDDLSVVAPPLQLGTAAWGEMEPPGELGRDTEAILAELGVDGDERRSLRSSGAVA
jgi:crotonobetainyl-CoA:carnitine CoA-transferase CaiB-like acyl-CoA transferase